MYVIHNHDLQMLKFCQYDPKLDNTATKWSEISRAFQKYARQSTMLDTALKMLKTKRATWFRV